MGRILLIMRVSIILIFFCSWLMSTSAISILSLFWLFRCKLLSSPSSFLVLLTTFVVKLFGLLSNSF